MVESDISKAHLSEDEGYLENVIDAIGLPSMFNVVFKYSDGEVSYFPLTRNIDILFKEKILNENHAPIYWGSYLFEGEVKKQLIDSGDSIVSLALMVWDKEGFHPFSIDENESVRIFIEKK